MVILNHYTEAESLLQLYPDSACSNIKGKTIVITGGNCGLGKETARVLAMGGAKVIIACRSISSGREAIQSIKESTVLQSESSLDVQQLDLSDFQSIQSFATTFTNSNRPLHILINNAGVMATPKDITKDGYEIQMGVNHLGHFLLAQLLLSILIKSGTEHQPSRVINVSSVGHLLFGPSSNPKKRLSDRLQPLDMNNSSIAYDRFLAYGDSKLANILFSKALNATMINKKLPVISVSLHPGNITDTSLKRHAVWMPPYAICQFIYNFFNFFLFNKQNISFFKFLFQDSLKSISQGAATQVYCAVANHQDIIPGGYYMDCKIEKEFINPVIHDNSLANWFYEESMKVIIPIISKR